MNPPWEWMDEPSKIKDNGDGTYSIPIDLELLQCDVCKGYVDDAERLNALFLPVCRCKAWFKITDLEN